MLKIKRCTIQPPLLYRSINKMRLLNCLNNDKGVALLLAVTIVTVLITVTVQFSQDMRQELMGSANVRSINVLGIIAKSGYNLAEAVLLTDASENSFDTELDGWAELSGQSLSSWYPEGTLSVTIDDLSGRLQLNSLAGSADGGGDGVVQRSREILQRLLVSGIVVDMSDEEASALIDAITDWVDKDDEETGITETESSYYRQLQPSYSCRNGPLEFVEELLLIRGMTPELYYGNAERLGLRDLVTVHGSDGTVNINTAPQQVLQVLELGMTEELAKELIAFRREESNQDQLASPGWYAAVLPGDVELNSDMIVTVSNYFQVNATARKDELEKNLQVVVQRKPDNTISVINRKIE